MLCLERGCPFPAQRNGYCGPHQWKTDAAFQTFNPESGTLLKAFPKPSGTQIENGSAANPQTIQNPSGPDPETIPKPSESGFEKRSRSDLDGIPKPSGRDLESSGTPPAPALVTQRHRIFEAIRAGARTGNEISRVTGIPIGSVSGVMSQLLSSGYIRRVGGRFEQRFTYETVPGMELPPARKPYGPPAWQRIRDLLRPTPTPMTIAEIAEHIGRAPGTVAQVIRHRDIFWETEDHKYRLRRPEDPPDPGST
jgi:hypothetical protein